MEVFWEYKYKEKKNILGICSKYSFVLINIIIIIL